jgi:CRP-like cAMP-binding protein
MVDSSCSDHLPFISLLSDDEISQVRERSNLIRYKKRDIIFRQDMRTSHIMLVISGLVKIFKEGRNERSIILKLAVPGEFIGMMSIMGDQIYQYSAAAVEETEICMVDLHVFKNLIMSNGKYGYELIKLVSRGGLYIFDRLLGQSVKQLPGRIADVLLYFSSQIYKNTCFEFPLTRRELAELAGTTKESFIRTLSEFKNDRIINLDGTRVEIVSMDIIKTLSLLG